MNKKKIIISLIINLVILVPTIIIVIYGILNGAISSQPGDGLIGLGYFKTYTMDSNIFAAITSFLIIIYDIKLLRKKVNLTPNWLANLHIMSTTSVLLTMLTTAIFLAPMQLLHNKSFFTMYEGELISFHLLNPIFSFISFMCLNIKEPKNIKQSFFGTIPTFIYAIVYLLMVVVFQKWSDFYGFTFNGNYYLVPFVFIIMNLIAFGIAFLLIKLHTKKKRV